MEDARRILFLRGARAFAYGFTSVLLGIHLADVLSAAKAGAILTATLAGSAALTAVLGARGHRVGRRRAHVALSLAMAAAMAVFAATTSFPLLLLAALTGTVAVATLEAGPLAALEQSMLPHVVPAERRNRWFGRYTAVAAILGSFGALTAGGPEVIRRHIDGAPSSQRWFLLPAALALLSRSPRSGCRATWRHRPATRRRCGARRASWRSCRRCSRSTAWAAGSSCRHLSSSG
ncbi:MAG: MFS transporter, partial [Actinomycetota bacterium]